MTPAVMLRAATAAAAAAALAPEAAEASLGTPWLSSMPVAAEAALGRLETALKDGGEGVAEDLAPAVQALKEVAFSMSSGKGQDVQLQKALFAVVSAAEALAVPVDASRIVWFTADPPWVFRRLTLLRRAQLLAASDWGWAGGEGLRALLAGLGLRWPRASAVPGRVLRSLRCRVANASMARWLAVQAPPDGTAVGQLPCRQDLAVFDVVRWRRERQLPQAAPVDFYHGLTPQLNLRPVLAGKAADAELVRHVMGEYVTDSTGLFLEFGVYTGTSLNIIARRLRALAGGRVYGFDSFEGLPAAWRGAGADGDLPEGTFRLDGLPAVEPNAELVVGLFNETLPRFLEAVPAGPAGVLRLVHLDADLYSSTLEVLVALRPLMQPGCLLVMDDFLNFPGFKDSGLQALADFLADASAPSRLEVLAAPWHIYDAPESLAQQPGAEPLPWDPRVRSDLERAVAFRIL